MKVRPLVALDIGSTKVACAIGLSHERSSGFELLGSSLVPYPVLSEVWLGDPLTVSRTIEHAIEATAVSGAFDRALVSMSHPLLVSERVRVGITLGDEPVAIRARDLDRLQTSALHQVLGIDREPLLVEPLGYAGNGFEGVRDPRGLCATRLLGTFHILTIPMAARRALVQAVEAAGLEVAHLTSSLPPTLASMTHETLTQRRVLLVDMGGLTTDLGLFVDRLLHASRIMPSGGLTLATTIAKDLQVTLDQALTWSLEGMACRKPEVRSLMQRQWELLEQAIQELLDDQPRPDAAIVSGRGALIDGFAEWVERTVGTTTLLCRSARTSTASDLPRQMGLSTAIGLLELFTRPSHEAAARSEPLFNRLIGRTRTILTEYF